ncbi:MAG: hypothetical protein AAGK47_09410, partial [Bacteroidota bacterium]
DLSISNGANTQLQVYEPFEIERSMTARAINVLTPQHQIVRRVHMHKRDQYQPKEEMEKIR